MIKGSVQKPKITIICARDYKDRNKGDIVVAHSFVLALSEFSDLSIICLSKCEKKDFINVNKEKIRIYKIRRPQLFEIIVAVMKNVFTSAPLQYALFSNVRVRKMVIKRLKELRSDITISLTSRAWAMHLGKVGKYNYLHLIDVLSKNFDSMANNQKRIISKLFYKIEARRLRKDEGIIDINATGVWQVAARDNEGFNPQRIIIPIVYNLPENSLHREEIHSKEIVFLGTLSYWPNVEAVHWFVDNVFPIVKKSLPNAIFKVAGKGKIKLDSRIYSVPGVNIVGAVIDTIEYLSQAAVIVVPVRKGTGMQNKILEASWLGKEIVCTKFAAEPFNKTCKEGLRITDDAKQFAREVIESVQKPRSKKVMKAWARSLQQSYSVESLRNNLYEILCIEK
jgi:hypothetical protein|tara:strand:+ start:1422 stop:2606 length:1185 start_codon:yes stop_codon:yes gene_type:complete